eukprot:361075-Chlamydomonas_euryale.AAC.4
MSSHQHDASFRGRRSWPGRASLLRSKQVEHCRFGVRRSFCARQRARPQGALCSDAYCAAQLRRLRAHHQHHCRQQSGLGFTPWHNVASARMRQGGWGLKPGPMQMRPGPL